MRKVSPEHKLAVRRKCAKAYVTRARANGTWQAMQRRWKLSARYGITIEQYAEMMQVQESKCALCRYIPSPRKRLAVDHDHVTGEVRGLLCHWCNKYLGWIGDTPDKLARVLLYQQEGYRALYNAAN